MTEKLQIALNEQITAELWSANLYLSMSFFLKREGFEGFSHWMRKQYQEEVKHAAEVRKKNEEACFKNVENFKKVMQTGEENG